MPDLTVILGADFHVRDDKPGELEYSEKLIEEVTTLGYFYKAPVLHLGDFFHSKRPSVELAIRMQEKLEYAQAHGVDFFLLKGNHDTCYPAYLDYSSISVFRNVAIPILRPVCTIQRGCFLGFLPWLPVDIFRIGIKQLSQAALDFPGPRFLFSHVSLQEGNVSASNGKIDTPLRAADLCPTAWSAIFLGDYHAAQQVAGQQIYYLGSPRPQTFGDFDNIGAWRLEVTLDGPGGKARFELIPHPLAHLFPAFRSWRVEHDRDLPLPGYNPADRNRIYCSLELKTRVQTLYPDALPVPLEKTGDLATGAERLKQADIEKLTSVQIIERWVGWKNLPQIPYQNEAIRILGGAP